MVNPLETIRDRAAALVAKLDQVHADKRFEAVWDTAQAHLGPYTGPSYTAELNALDLALALAAEPPEPSEGQPDNTLGLTASPQTFPLERFIGTEPIPENRAWFHAMVPDRYKRNHENSQESPK